MTNSMDVGRCSGPVVKVGKAPPKKSCLHELIKSYFVTNDDVVKDDLKAHWEERPRLLPEAGS
jgi:hypothetical protein